MNGFQRKAENGYYADLAYRQTRHTVDDVHPIGASDTVSLDESYCTVLVFCVNRGICQIRTPMVNPTPLLS
jgi:hypothetical protein